MLYSDLIYKNCSLRLVRVFDDNFLVEFSLKMVDILTY